MRFPRSKLRATRVAVGAFLHGHDLRRKLALGDLAPADQLAGRGENLDSYASAAFYKLHERELVPDAKAGAVRCDRDVARFP